MLRWRPLEISYAAPSLSADPASLEARRRNTQKSPRTARGKVRVRLHAHKLGCRSAHFTAYVAERLHLDRSGMLRLPATGVGIVLNILTEHWLVREWARTPRELPDSRRRRAQKRQNEMEFIEAALARYPALGSFPYPALSGRGRGIAIGRTGRADGRRWRDHGRGGGQVSSKESLTPTKMKNKPNKSFIINTKSKKQTQNKPKRTQL